MYASGEGVSQDRERAFSLFRKGCESGYPMACFHVARALETGSGVTPDPGEAARYYAQVCDGDLKDAAAAACFNLGLNQLQGLGIPAEPGHAVVRLKQACSLGRMEGCAGLGIAVSSGLGGAAPDPEQAARLFTQACEGGSSDGCYNLGLAYRDGEGVTVDAKQAKLLFAKACTMGVKEACTTGLPSK